MSKIHSGINQGTFNPNTVATLDDVRAKAKALQQRLREDKFEAGAFKDSPKAFLARQHGPMADIRELGLCASCRTTCGITEFCGVSRR